MAKLIFNLLSSTASFRSCNKEKSFKTMVIFAWSSPYLWQQSVSNQL